MEEEKIIITNEENNYDAVIVENTDDIIYDETIQIIELDKPEIFDVGTDEAFVSFGMSQNKESNHNNLYNRDSPDQHTIGSITGLRQELDEIQSLKTVESDKRGSANYYMWKDTENPIPTDRIGYFVSIHTKNHKVSICNEKDEIFGVTVSSAGFVGRQEYNAEDKPRDDEYALVANTGVVKVRCWSDVVAGDYVMSSNDGTAMKTRNAYGYYVISIDDSDGIRHAVISLDSTMNQVYDLSLRVDEFNGRVDAVEIKANAAISSANDALHGFGSDVNSALQNSQDAMNGVNSVLDKIADLENNVTSVKGQVEAIDDKVVNASQDAAQEAVNALMKDTVATKQDIIDLQGSLNSTQVDIENSLDAVRDLAKEIDPIIKLGDETTSGAAYLVASAQDNAVQLAAISQCLSNDFETLETWDGGFGRDPSQIFYVEDKELYYYYDVGIRDWVGVSEPSEAGLSEAIASVRQKTDKNEAMVENLTSSIGRDYEIITEWNGYEEVNEWIQGKSDINIIYKDITGEYHWFDPVDSNWKSDTTPPRDDLEIKDTKQIYYAEDTELYYYYDNGWRATVSPSVAGLVESIALIKQKANKNEAEIKILNEHLGGDGTSLTEITTTVKENQAAINSLTSYVKNDYMELDELWDKTDKDEDIIYFAQDPNEVDEEGNYVWKYWYFKTGIHKPDWYGTVDPSEAGLSASLTNINQTVTDHDAKISELATWKGKTDEAIARLQISSGQDGASMESLVMNISKYTVGEYSQAYGLTLEEAMELLRDDTVFVPSEDVSESYDRLVKLESDEAWNEEGKHSSLIYGKENTDKTWTYWYCNDVGVWIETDDIDTFTEPKKFLREFYYIWDKNSGTWADGGDVIFTSEYIKGNDDTQYIVVTYTDTDHFKYESKEEKSEVTEDGLYYIQSESLYYYFNNGTPVLAQDPYFEDGALYYWNTENPNHYWQKVATVESNTLNRAIAQMRQSVSDTGAEFSTSLTSTNEALVSEIGKVNDKLSSYVTVTDFDGKMAEVAQRADDNEAVLSMIVSKGKRTIDNWDINERDEDDKDTVFYVTSEERYYYWDGNSWVFTEDVEDPNIASKINSAGIIAAINDNGDTNLKIKAEQIDMEGTNINLDGYVKFDDLSGESGHTIINGSNIVIGPGYAKDVTEPSESHVTGHTSKAQSAAYNRAKRARLVGFKLYDGATITVTFNEPCICTSPILGIFDQATGTHVARFTEGDTTYIAQGTMKVFGKPITNTFESDGITLKNASPYNWTAGDTLRLKYHKSGNTVDGVDYPWWEVIPTPIQNIGQWCHSTDTTYIDGGKIYTGSITADKIAANAISTDKLMVGDFNNLSIVDPDSRNPYGATVVTGNQTIDGTKKYFNCFRFGELNTLTKWHQLDLNILNGNTVFNKGDKFLFRAKIYAHKGLRVSLILRAIYENNTTINLISHTIIKEDGTSAGTGSWATVSIPVTITGAVDATGTDTNTIKKVRSYKLFLEISKDSSNNAGYTYVRDISLYQMTNNVLIADGAITAAKLSTDAITSRNYSVDNDTGAITGTKMDLSSGSITSQNFKLDSSGNVDITGKLITRKSDNKQIIIDGYGIELYSGSSGDSAAISFCSSSTNFMGFDISSTDADLALAGHGNVFIGARPIVDDKVTWQTLCAVKKRGTNTSGKITSMTFEPYMTGYLGYYGDEHMAWSGIYTDKVELGYNGEVLSSTPMVRLTKDKVAAYPKGFSYYHRVELAADSNPPKVYFDNGSYYGWLFLDIDGKFKKYVVKKSNNALISNNVEI